MTDPDLVTRAFDGAAPARPPRRRWSLRRRLIVGIVVLLAVLSVAISGVSTAVLRGSLTDRLDRQLLESVSRSTAVVGGPALGGPQPTIPIDGDGDGDAPPPVAGFVRGEGAGAIGAIIVDGVVRRAAYLGVTGEDRDLSGLQVQTLLDLEVDGTPHTVAFGGSLGNYRVVASDLGDGTTLVVALPLDDVEATVTQLLVIIAAVTLLAMALAIVLGALVVRVALRPLDRVVATAGRVSELQLDAGEVTLSERVPAEDADGSTEVGRVGEALNRLLGRVESALTARQASEEKLRRFVADASHELRTPLASIRGYSEFVRRDAARLSPDAALSPDVTRSLARIDSESQRMTALVEDLLLLARLDSGPAIVRGPVDLARLAADAVSDAHAAGPDHRWQLDLAGEEVVVSGDATRLHQVVANLLTNARLHTPAGTTVTCTVVGGETTARIEVVDDGPGIAADLRPRLFERFVRGDDSRARVAGAASGGSTGLGLAIVRAIVEAHDGTVELASEPGRTAFTIVLPR
jgi:two-component system OmpR family sensor kinase